MKLIILGYISYKVVQFRDGNVTEGHMYLLMWSNYQNIRKCECDILLTGIPQHNMNNFWYNLYDIYVTEAHFSSYQQQGLLCPHHEKCYLLKQVLFC